MTPSTVDLKVLVARARTAGLDGRDRGAVRRLVWSEAGSDAVDHDVVDAVAERLLQRGTRDVGRTDGRSVVRASRQPQRAGAL